MPRPTIVILASLSDDWPAKAIAPATSRQRPDMFDAGDVDDSSGDDCQQYMGLAIAQHLDDGLSVYMMNCAHPSFIWEQV
jgi:hypothetical protein